MNNMFRASAFVMMLWRWCTWSESSGTLQTSSTTNEIQASFGLNLLPRAASEPHPLPPVAAASVEPTIPNDNQNKCSHRNCFLPFVPSTCCTMGCDGTVHQYCFHLYDQSNSSNVLPSLDELHAIHILLPPPHLPRCHSKSILSITSTHSLSYLFRLTLVLTHKLANGITLSAIIMSIVLLYKYSGGQQGPSPRFPSEQCFVCRDEGYESIRCSTPTTGRNCLHTCTLP